MRWAGNNVWYAVIAMLLLAVLPRVPEAAAQHDVAMREDVTIRIATNHPEAAVYADSIFIGIASQSSLQVPVSTREVRLVAADGSSWTIPPIMTELQAEYGDTVDVSLYFPHRYRIESFPFGAKVHHETGNDRKLLGSTPLLFVADEPLEGRLTVEQPGYVLERLDPGRDIWNRHVVLLSPSQDVDPRAAQVNWQPPGSHRAWIDYAAIGTAIAAGALAVHYKFRADDLYSSYDQTGDRMLRSQIKRYDLKSGIAFGAMQAGIGVFAVRLILR